MGAVNLTPSGGVITIDTSVVNNGDLVRISGTVTSWNVPAGPEASALPDGTGFLLQVNRTVGNTIAFTGLADTWLGPIPTIDEGSVVFFPMVLSGTNWIANTGASSAGSSSSVYTTHQTIVDSGNVAVNANDGLLVDIDVVGEITQLDVANMPERQEMSIWFIQGSTNQPIVLGPAWQRKGPEFDFDDRAGAIHEIIVWRRSGIFYYQNAGSVVSTSAQLRLTGLKVTAQSSS